VTPCMAALRHVFHINRESKLGDCRIKSLFFVWSCKDENDFEWYGDVLEVANARSNSGQDYPRLYVSAIFVFYMYLMRRSELQPHHICQRD
jgi:hypothetical protein